MRLRLSTAIIVLAMSLIIPDKTAAQICSQLTWGETATRAFVFSYQASVPLGVEIAEQYGAALDEEFNRFANLFNTSLPIPVMVRIYPNERDYYCFNALAPEIPIGQSHSHVGGREIALIAQNIQDHPDKWQQNALDILRGELAVLYLNFMSADNAPEGLQIGINVYAQDPFVAFDRLLQTTAPPYEHPSFSWRNLWDSPDLIANPNQAVQAASITAYLVDVYGWENFLNFVNALRTVDSWRSALEQTYPASADALENQWSDAYYPRFMSGRWQENALYSLSLAPYEQLINAGAYQAAADGLENIIALLIDLEEFEKLTRAELLNATAFKGLEADALARQARQAYLEGDFSAADIFAEQAIQIYIDLADVRNLESLLTIQKQAQEVIELNNERQSIEIKADSFFPPISGAELEEISIRLQQLGDPAGAAHAAELITQLNASRQRIATITAAFGSFIAVIIIFFRMKKFREPEPPEVQLQS